MTPRFAQTLRLAAQGAHSTRGTDGVQTGLRLSLGDLLQLHGEASGAVLLLMLALLITADSRHIVGQTILKFHFRGRLGAGSLRGRDANALTKFSTNRDFLKLHENLFLLAEILQKAIAKYQFVF